jgi:hypothetical protein
MCHIGKLRAIVQMILFKISAFLKEIKASPINLKGKSRATISTNQQS